VFLIKEKTIITPLLTDGCVAGTFRAYLLESLPALGLTVQEKSILKEDLHKADAVFLTNAIYNIRWVAEINGHQFNIGAIAALHRSLIQKFLN
jgi:branched-subunit amino acid aminotransferase/4-amino-4-deoxychorismate lyase